MSELTDMLRERARAALPKAEGEVRLPGLREPVEVLWDRWGVPHVYAANTHDLYFTQGYILASERLFQIEFLLRIGAGRLSELFGEATLPIDRFVRTVGWNRAAGRLLGQWDDLALEIAEAWTAGARAWVDRMPAIPIEYQFLSAEPLGAEGMGAVELGIGASLFMGWALSANWDAELLRAEIAEKIGWDAMVALFPEIPTLPAAVGPGKQGGERARRSALELLRAAQSLPNGQGSNNWVVSGRRSVTGRPLLANDPHILVQQPSMWFEMHLSAPGIDVRGVALPFAAGILLGHNDRIAWGATNVSGDVQDLYLERLNPEGTAALHDGLWEPLTVHREEIAVRGRSAHEILAAKESRHGPILDSYLVGMTDIDVVEGGVTETYALRWVGLEEGITSSTVHRLNTAQNWEEFRAAVSGWACPGQNFVYADVDGNIGYQCTGLHPIRRRGDGTVPAPGWISDYEWEGYVPFEELPRALNPDEGFIATANAKPHDDTYPYLLGHDFLPPFRAMRVAQMITEAPAHDVASFARIQFDWLSLPAMAIVPRLLEVEPGDDRQKQALEILASWDFRLAPDSAGAAIYQVWSMRVAEAILLPLLGEQLYDHYYARRQWSNEFQTTVLPKMLEFPQARWFGGDGRGARDQVLRTALDRALDELTSRLGEDMAGWSWGGIHRVRFAGRFGALLPELAELFTAGEAPWGGDEMTVNQGTFEPGPGTYDTAVVASWRQIIDLSDFDRSVGTHTVGQSGNPASRHWNDLFPLWSTGRHHALPFTRKAVEAATESRLELLPEAEE